MEKFSNECCDTLEKCWLHANQVIFLRINYLCELVVRSSVTFLTPLQAAFHWKFLEKAMATHSSTLAWKIPWTEEPGRLQSMGSLRVRHDWASSLSLFTFVHWRRKWQPTSVFLPGEENPRDGGAWWAAIYGVAQGRTWLKWLSSSSRLS